MELKDFDSCRAFPVDLSLFTEKSAELHSRGRSSTRAWCDSTPLSELDVVAGHYNGRCLFAECGLFNFTWSSGECV